ncbi:peptide chain release factor 1 [Photorhabdus noenieputensis]|uniref:protein RtxH n=1 Tax=Photorhabdus noenieputensis TaxID=1208607 RepID=UPI001BD66B91|nr:peptide chain release factor 1 [Photorhabdus noenieputensis]MBS9437880.1 peptide chain release factor 1 [Photorhabdus noenieputensis]MCK3668327.1 peptide chain release factor 1 [Photorhabdus noenieputensis]
MSEKFVQTISSVNYNKGVFSLYFVGQEPNRMANGIMAENDNVLELKQVIHMPASGFMYMVSMVKNMLEDPRMAAEFDKLVAAGFLPAPQVAEEQEEQIASESIAEESANVKKRLSKNAK